MDEFLRPSGSGTIAFLLLPLRSLRTLNSTKFGAIHSIPNLAWQVVGELVDPVSACSALPTLTAFQAAVDLEDLQRHRFPKTSVVSRGQNGPANERPAETCNALPNV